MPLSSDHMLHIEELSIVDRNLRVCHITDSISRQWKLSLLEGLIKEEDKQVIEEIPLPSRCREDKLI